MAFSPQAHVIKTGGDGRLVTTTTTDVDAMTEAICRSERAVLHFLGGLDSEASEFRTAERLFQVYGTAGAYPVFFARGSGLTGLIIGNLTEIANEDLFKRLLRKVLAYAVGKAYQSGDDRAAGVLPIPDETSVNRELVRRARDEEPYDHVEPAGEVAMLDEDERAKLEAEVADDPAVQQELAAILAWHKGTTSGAARGVYAVAPKPSKISPDVLDELVACDEGARGIAAAVALAVRAGRVLIRVIHRFRSGTDHGVYPTVVEELLRTLYLADLGGALWHTMKRETFDTFVDAAEPRGGDYLRDRLAAGLKTRMAAGQSLPKITLVGHSAGAVFIDHLLEAVDKRRAGFPPAFRFRNVVLLAPANTYEHFAAALTAATLVDRFRMFTMTDEAERADHLLGGFYPRSLLHFIAGVLERDSENRSAYNPVAGMSRYLDSAEPAKAIRTVRDYLVADPTRVVRSPTASGAGAGLRSGATTHGGFDEDPLVLESLGSMIRGG